MTNEPTSRQAFERVLRFGRFSLDPARKLLLEDGRAVRLGGRALDLLIALVERAGDVVDHDELFARVWPHTVVEESSLRVHMSALRKALGDGVGDLRYIASHAGRGYSFVMEVVEGAISSSADEDGAAACVPAAMTSAPPLPALPPRLTGIVGREHVLAALSAKLGRHRLVTIVGPGGIGKTTVALALAEEIASRHAEGVAFVDLAPLGDATLVAAALAAALGIPVPAQSPWPTLEATLAKRDLLIVLDNCEHLIAATAALAERVLHAAPRARILATSREPLEAESEAIHRLGSLELPSATRQLDVADALAFPALRLFVERATASADDFVLSASNLDAIVRLCRHLDGMPLAIELAAARAGSLGIHALAQRLEDVFRLLRRGRRTALPRHQTLQALLDWSHGLLGADEQTVLHRLSAFRSSFTLEAAADLASCERIARGRVVDCVLSLVSKSLVELESAEASRYRLLFVTRLHAGEMLASESDAHVIGRRHATCLHGVLVRANAEVRGKGAAVQTWASRHAPALADIRAAIDWAQAPGGDTLLAARLIVESDRLLLELGLNDEMLSRALDMLAPLRNESSLPPQLELRLLCLLCMADGQSLTDRSIPPELPARLDELAQRTGSPSQQRTALYALCVNAFGRGDYPGVLECAQRMGALPCEPADSGDLVIPLVGRRFAALGKHYLGDQRAAWQDSVHVLERARNLAGSVPYVQMPFEVSMGIQQARILWLQGHSERALQRAFDATAASEGAHSHAFSQALALAVIPILLWRGEDEQASTFLDRLVDHALLHFQSFWLAWAASYCSVLAIRGRDVEGMRRRLGTGWNRMNAMQSDMLGTLASEMVNRDQLARVEDGIVGWCAPEILRVHGESLLLRPADAARAESMLLRSLALARHQGARAWELRAANSVAALWQATGRRGAAHELLTRVVDGFTEGLDCIDMRRARARLASLEVLS